MLRVKIKDNCFDNHRPPHVPWYVNKDISGLMAGFSDIIWFAKSHNDNATYFEIIGFECGMGNIMKVAGNPYIKKADCDVI